MTKEELYKIKNCTWLITPKEGLRMLYKHVTFNDAYTDITLKEKIKEASVGTLIYIDKEDRVVDFGVNVAIPNEFYTDCIWSKYKGA